MTAHSNKRKKAARALLAAAALVTAGILSACSGGGTTSTDPSAQGGGDDLKVGFVPAIYPHPYFLSMEDELNQKADEYGYDLLLQGSPEYSPEAQVPILESLLASNLDALILAPTDTKALNAVLAKYKAQNIPVFLVDAGITDPSLVVTTIQTDNYQGGVAAADALAEAIGETGTVAVESFEPGSGAGAPRVKGFQDRMNEEYPNITVLEPQYGKNDVSLSATQVSSYLIAHPDLAGVFGANTASANGAAQAIKTAKKQGEVVVVGYDAGPEEIDNLRNGLFDVTIAQHPAEEASLAMDAIYQYFSGDRDAIEAEVVTGVTVVTKANIDDPDVSQYFYKKG